MNTKKDNFLLKKKRRSIIESLSNEDAGILIKAIYKYAETGESDLNGLLNSVFIVIKEDIDENEQNYALKCLKNKENIEKRWGQKQESEEIQNDTIVSSGKEEDTKIYEPIPNDTDARHISHIHNNNNLNYLDIIKKIIDYLNNKTKSKFKYSTKITQEKIIARLNEGYKLDDFIVVIDKKSAEWLNDAEFVKYLCPETLFGRKFEKYLNQKVITKKEQEWLNKDVKSEIASVEEQEQMKKMLEEI